MSYYAYEAAHVTPGLPGWQFSPVPGWQSNPATVWSPELAVGSVGCPCLGVGQTEGEDKKPGWGMVLLAGLGGAILGWALASTARADRAYARNARVIRFPTRRRREPAWRRKLPAGQFVYPERRSWPIESRYHARKAIAYAKWPQHRTRKAEVLRSVARRWEHDPEVSAALVRVHGQAGRRALASARRAAA